MISVKKYNLNFTSKVNASCWVCDVGCGGDDDNGVLFRLSDILNIFGGKSIEYCNSSDIARLEVETTTPWKSGELFINVQGVSGILDIAYLSDPWTVFRFARWIDELTE